MDGVNDLILIRAKFMARHLNEQNVRSATLLILYDLRVPLNYVGFDYILKGIPEALESSSQIMAGEIYGLIGSQYIPKVEAKNIEVAIRDAIRAAWNSGADGRWENYFPEYMLRRRKPPSNLEFIAAIVYFLMLWQDCCVKEVNYANV